MPNINDKDIFRRKVDDFSDEFTADALDTERWSILARTPIYTLDTAVDRLELIVDSSTDIESTAQARNLVTLPSAKVP